jgi:hypothetical protein
MNTTRIAPIGAAVLAAVALLSQISPLRADSEQGRSRPRRLTVTKECSQPNFTGAAGSFCTITSSNLGRIRVGSTVTYDQAFGIPAGMLDSNVVLDAGNGDRAVGRCTLDGSTGLGLCTFSDGTGRFAGFNARVDVSYQGGVDWAWDGTYSFSQVP